MTPAAGRPQVHRPKDLSRIVFWSAAELSTAIRTRLVTCVEVMTAYLDHIGEVNARVNAIVSMRPRADLLVEAGEKDRLLRTGTYQGWMHGFPHAVKDLADVAGLPTSFGLLPPADSPAPATQDALFVERIRAAGAIFIGKTNTPELGLGSHTYNNVFGTTLNAYDQTKSAGGSSGGAAVAVALRMVPVADGSDFMGSLRNPPGWNNVYGLRPSFGRVPEPDGEQFVSQAGVIGPIARNATDLALLLRTMSGYDDRAPLSLHDDAPGRKPSRGGRIAWFGDLGGYLPMDPEVLRVTRAALSTFTALGMTVTTLDDLPCSGSFTGKDDLWPTWLTLHRFRDQGRLPRPGAAPTAQTRGGLRIRRLGKAHRHRCDGGLGAAQRPVPRVSRTLRDLRLRRAAHRSGHALRRGPALAGQDRRHPDVHVPPLDGGDHHRHVDQRTRPGPARGLQHDRTPHRLAGHRPQPRRRRPDQPGSGMGGPDRRAAANPAAAARLTAGANVALVTAQHTRKMR